MISCVSWIGRGRLAARPLQYELAPEAVEQLITKQQEMQLHDSQHDADGEKPYHDDDDDDDDDEEEDEEQEMAAIEKLSQHIAGGDDEEAEEEEGANGEHDVGDSAEADTAAAAEDVQSPASDAEAEADADADADSRMRDVVAKPKGTRSRRRKRLERQPDPFSLPDPEGDAVLAEMRMDEYDVEPDGAELFLGGRKLTVHDSNASDPYITVQDEDDDGSDDEDVVIRASDSVLCVGRTEQEHSAIELYVYDEDSGSLFVHHDFNIPSFPLCMQHVDCGPSVDSASAASSGAFLAVGSFLPGIEVWNLDVLDVLEPVCTLGGYEDGRVNMSSSSRKGRKRELKPGSHEDAVLCLSWHAAHRERLASGSADESVKLWDLTTQQCTATLTHHKDRAAQPQPKAAKKEKRKKQKSRKAGEAEAEDDDSWYAEAQAANTSHKVQSIQFNPTEPSLLLTGSYDRSVQLIDVRLPAAASASASRVYSVDSDVEMVRWHPHAALFLVATESGLVCLFDARNPSAPLFRLAAHDGAATSAAFNPRIPSLFLTSGADKTCKLWSLPASGLQPSLLVSKEMKVGSVWSAGWDVDVAAVLACGGDKGKVAVWDIRENADVVRKYGKELGEEAADAAATGVADGADERKADSETVESKAEAEMGNGVAASTAVEEQSAERKERRQKRKSKKTAAAAAATHGEDDV